MSNPVEKMTIKNLADELGVSKNTVRNQLVNSGFDLAQYKENGIIMLDNLSGRKQLADLQVENKKLKEENRSLRQRLERLKNAFQKSITRLSIRFGLAEKDMGLSEELEVLEQEKTLFYRQNVSQRKLERSEDEIEW